MEEGGSQVQDFAAILYAEPGALGLISNIVAALLVATENCLEPPFTSTALTISGIHLIIVGGILQIVAGLLSYRRWDHLTGTAFIVFGSLWTSVGLSRILAAQNVDAEALRVGTLPGMIGFMAVAVILCVCAVTVNYILPPVLVALLMTLIFEGVGASFAWGRRVAAAFELFIVITSVYAVVVMMLKGVSQRYILPGFGNAPYDPLLMRAAGGPAPKINEKKKVTKYSEPMGMGFLGNVVPAAVMAFHHLGFFHDFRPAIVMFVFSALMQVLGSFYSFLRHDFFHSISFILYAIFWNSRAILQFLMSMNFPQILDSRVNFFGQWTLIGLLIILTLISASHNRVVFLYNIMFVIMAILSVDHIPIGAHNFTFGVTAAITAILSLYVGMSALENSIAEKAVMYIGAEVVPVDLLKRFFGTVFRTTKEKEEKNEYEDDDVIDVKIVDCMIFTGSTIALMALSASEATNPLYPLPWIMVAGVFLHLFAARLAYAAGSLAKAYSSLILAIFWIIWTVFFLNANIAFVLRPLSVGILCLFTAVMVMTPTFTRVWIPFILFMELCIITQVVAVFGANPRWMILVTALLAAIMSLYAAFAEYINSFVQAHVVPVGEPLLKEKVHEQDNASAPCPLFPSRRSSALQKVARLLDQGFVVGVPTDTVYALAASCKHPESIRKLYMIKGRPAEKPICLCLSSLDQLADVKPPFSDLLWNFMRRCYPGGISCVVPKGEWLQRLGLGDSISIVGTAESICIRVPDSSVLAYLISVSGPVALTSANPSGGEDSTHHDMVINSLGEKLDGVICDGKSNELVASTVVSCLKIDEGIITYFRLGCTPKEVVDAHFEAAKAEIASKAVTLNMSEKLSQ